MSGGLEGLLGNGDDGGDEAEASSPPSSTEDEYLDDAFDALGKDRKAFRAAMKKAVRACMDSYGEK